MRLYTIDDGAVSPEYTLMALIPETDFTEEEFESVASMMVGDTLSFEGAFISFTVKRVS